MLTKYGFVAKNYLLVAYVSNVLGGIFALTLSYYLVYFDQVAALQLELAVHGMTVCLLFGFGFQLAERERARSERFLLTQNRIYLYSAGFLVLSYVAAYLIPLGHGIQLAIISAVILGVVLSMLAGYLRLLKRWLTPKERLLLWDNFQNPSRLALQLEQSESYELLGTLQGNQGDVVSEEIENIAACEGGSLTYDKTQIVQLIRSDRLDVIVTANAEDESLQAFQTELKIKGLRNAVRFEVLSPTLNELNLASGELSIEKLLDRDPIVPDEGLMHLAAHGKRIVVTGAGGTIGSEIAQQIAIYEPSLIILLDQSEFGLYNIEIKLNQLLSARRLSTQVVPLLGSVTDRNRLDAIFQAYHIDTVYHAAAYKHVPMVEHNVLEGVRNNILGTRIIAEVAARHEVKSFILVSTDKAVRPTSIMGATKRFSELVVQGLVSEYPDTCFAVVRFGNVLGSSGSVIPRFIEQIKQGGPVTVTHKEVTRYFMSIPEAAQLVVQAGAMATGGEVYLLEMGRSIKIADLAKRLVNELGFQVKSEGRKEGIEIRFTGLRPGEKLYEELLVDGSARKTKHPRIMVAQDFSLEWREVEALLSELVVGLDDNDCKSVRDVLLHAGTGYVPQHGLNDLLWLTLEPEPKLVAENVVPIFDEPVQKKVV